MKVAEHHNSLLPPSILVGNEEGGDTAADHLADLEQV